MFLQYDYYFNPVVSIQSYHTFLLLITIVHVSYFNDLNISYKTVVFKFLLHLFFINHPVKDNEDNSNFSRLLEIILTIEKDVKQVYFDKQRNVLKRIILIYFRFCRVTFFLATNYVAIELE